MSTRYLQVKCVEVHPLKLPTADAYVSVAISCPFCVCCPSSVWCQCFCLWRLRLPGKLKNETCLLLCASVVSVHGGGHASSLFAILYTLPNSARQVNRNMPPQSKPSACVPAPAPACLPAPAPACLPAPAPAPACLPAPAPACLPACLPALLHTSALATGCSLTSKPGNMAYTNCLNAYVASRIHVLNWSQIMHELFKGKSRLAEPFSLINKGASLQQQAVTLGLMCFAVANACRRHCTPCLGYIKEVTDVSNYSHNCLHITGLFVEHTLVLHSLLLRRFRPGNESEEAAPVSVATFIPNHNSRLSALIVKGLNGTVYDLSTDFQADVSQYGVMVTEQSTNATLCIEAAHGEWHPWCVEINNCRAVAHLLNPYIQCF